MRVTFIDNLLLEQGADGYHFDLQPHLGLISLLAVLRQGGHQGTLIDPKLEVSSGRLLLDASLYENIAELVLASQPDVVGMTSLGCNFMATAKIAAHLKRRSPDLPVLLGGPHASILDVAVLQRFPQFDLVVRGEAELTLLPLLDSLHSRQFSGLLGITHRSAQGVHRSPDAPLVADLDTLAPAAYDHYPVAQAGQELLRVEAGRGCPFACTFCSTASFFGRRYRLKSAERLCSDLDRLHETYGISHFALTHDLFTVNKTKVREFCEAVAPRGYTWTCSARMDCVDSELLDAMARAGCRSIYYGVETGSPRMQKEVAKRLDLALFWPTLEATSRTGMESIASFITGYPQETAEDQQMTLDLIGEAWIRHADMLTTQLHLLTPEPGTELLDQYRDQLAYDGHISDFNLPALEADDADITRNDPEIFVNHHYYRGVLPRQRHVLVTSVYRALCRLNRNVQRHLLARYNNSLGGFFDDLLSWAGTDADAPSDAPELLQTYLAGRWGAEDYLLSLVRYLLAASDPVRGASGGAAGLPEPRSHSTHPLLQLSPVPPCSGTSMPVRRSWTC
ncbi:B12-binding domain-containing radical SAM protein [Streptomyces sp. NBC_00162]|uniref:B12-binding domain-containing radical SAM protein n=1 Tax=Streptomyces sp. NBC_00162 TaxID=2903629 RepID=UPI00214C47A6|nr:radical SAM protein [Streptomyces sp. NBC_00162]UUU37477.1 B12-binding domain-containing radical SAM protein [Streptomyces sp. NBC_00162]